MSKTLDFKRNLCAFVKDGKSHAVSKADLYA